MSKVSPQTQKELEKSDKSFYEQQEANKSLTLDEMNKAPRLETEQQTKISQREAQAEDGIYLKPSKSLSTRNKFNEEYRKDWEYAKEYVKFIAEHKEVIGDVIEIWTLPFAGVPAEFWNVPTNKVVWGPRYLAEQIKKCSYHRLRTEDRPVSIEGGITYTGQLTVDNIIQRLDAMPVSTKKSIFMGKF